MHTNKTHLHTRMFVWYFSGKGRLLRQRNGTFTIHIRLKRIEWIALSIEFNKIYIKYLANIRQYILMSFSTTSSFFFFSFLFCMSVCTHVSVYFLQTYKLTIVAIAIVLASITASSTLHRKLFVRNRIGAVFSIESNFLLSSKRNAN